MPAVLQRIVDGVRRAHLTSLLNQLQIEVRNAHRFQTDEERRDSKLWIQETTRRVRELQKKLGGICPN